MVALLAFTLATDPGTEGWWPSPTTVSTVAGLVGMAASFAGNEMAVRFGRILIVRLMMMTSAVMAAIIGFAAELGYGAMVALTLVYNAAVLADSAALTAGAVEAADLHRRGATLALHSLCGFAAAAVGPVALGLVLDLTGGAGTAASWGWGFASVAAVGVLGPLALRLATGGLSRGPADGPGDGRR
jgi:MFS family permease